jgi:ferrochelatase
MIEQKSAVLLINVGTPDDPGVKSVRRFLFQFLNDRRVVDLPLILQKILVNLIVVPFRAPKSAKLYQRLWTENGSSLLYYSEQAKLKLQEKLNDRADVFLAMRYGNPSIESVLSTIKQGNYSRLIVWPLFPQYASSTTETAKQAVLHKMKSLRLLTEVQFIDQFYDHNAFLDAWELTIRSFNPDKYEHLLFSFHGLPNRQLDQTHPGHSHLTCNCQYQLPAFGNNCYKATCYQTARSLAKRLGLKSNQYTVCFQSRLSNNWMTPFTDQTIITLAQKGIGTLLVAAPAFVSDCLETTVEIGHEYKELFRNNGGKSLQLVDSLNASPQWIDAMEEILNPYL